MGVQDNLSAASETIRSATQVITRPVRTNHSPEGIIIQPYRGFGSYHEVFAIGRVLRQQHTPKSAANGNVLKNIWRRMSLKGLSDEILTVRFGAASTQVRSDRNGFFHIRLKLPQAPPDDRRWYDLHLQLANHNGFKPQATVPVYVPPRSARHVIISDIDDTIINTGVANKIRMLWRLFAQKAASRTAFPGVAAFYRALHHGISQIEYNPMLYVSRAPWAIYEVLEEFFKMHDIPVGPILFLRYWGLNFYDPWPRRSHDHKIRLIRNMLNVYDRLPFILIGDSGQKDPEIYARIVQEHPERIKAVYIRNVSRDPQRQRAIEILARQVLDAGSSLVLAADCFAMAEHAAQQGYISSEALVEIFRERVAEGKRSAPEPLHAVQSSAARPAKEAIAQGALQKALEGDDKADGSANILVETDE